MKDYENLALNIAEIKRYLQQQKEMVPPPLTPFFKTLRQQPKDLRVLYPQHTIVQLVYFPQVDAQSQQQG